MSLCTSHNYQFLILKICSIVVFFSPSCEIRKCLQHVYMEHELSANEKYKFGNNDSRIYFCSLTICYLFANHYFCWQDILHGMIFGLCSYVGCLKANSHHDGEGVGKKQKSAWNPITAVTSLESTFVHNNNRTNTI